MKVIDLTHLIEPNMLVFPGLDKPVLTSPCSVEKDGCKVSKLEIFAHVGTHIDAPSHMLADGINLDEIDCANFFGKAKIFDARSMNKIEKSDIEQMPLSEIDFVILYTGWQEKWGDNQYYEDFPLLTKEAAELLSTSNIKGVGMDAIAIDAVKDSNYTNHKIMFENNKLIIENLTNLDKLGEDIFEAVFLPLKVKGFEGFPIRACAFV